MQNQLIETVYNMTGLEKNESNSIKITAYINEILSYLNRDDIIPEIFPVMAEVISLGLISNNDGSVQSLSEGDLSITYNNKSPFFGKLDSFKLVRGIKDDV